MTDFKPSEESDLNDLMNNNKINKPSNCIKIVAMVNNHDIKKESEVKDMMDKHKNDGCEKESCNLVCTNGMEELSEQMHEKQKKEFGYYKYSVEKCYEYIFDVFTSRTVRGVNLEQKGIKHLENQLSFDCDIRKASEKMDNDYSVDLVVSKKDIDICGIQVKPKSYDFIDDKTQKINQIKNNKYELPVFYLTYNDDKDWINTDKVVNQVEEHTLSIAHEI